MNEWVVSELEGVPDLLGCAGVQRKDSLRFVPSEPVIKLKMCSCLISHCFLRGSLLSLPGLLSDVKVAADGATTALTLRAQVNDSLTLLGLREGGLGGQMVEDGNLVQSEEVVLILQPCRRYHNRKKCNAFGRSTLSACFCPEGGTSGQEPIDIQRSGDVLNQKESGGEPGECLHQGLISHHLSPKGIPP